MAEAIWHQQLVVPGHATVWSDRPLKVREADNRPIAYYDVSLRWVKTQIQADGGVDGNLNTDAKQPSHGFDVMKILSSNVTVKIDAHMCELHK